PKAKVESTGLIPDFVIKLPPMAMPRTLTRIMGTQAGRLRLTGSQKITIGGTQTKRDTKAVTEYGGNSNFALNMRQDLNMNLTGTFGEKITVNIKYNSNQETALLDPNNINIKYTGDEDEIVQSIEAGNTSLSLTGSRYANVTASSQGLFGVKSVLKFGDLNITAIASKEESQKNTKTYKGTSQADSSVVRSSAFSKGKRYYLFNPEDLYELYSESDNVPAGWVNNAIKTDALGAWIVNHDYATNRLPRNTTFRLFIDNDIGTVTDFIKGTFIDYKTGEPIVVPNNDDLKFVELIEDRDFYVDYGAGIVTMVNTVKNNAYLGITFTDLSGNTYGEVIDNNPDPEDNSVTLIPIKMLNQTVDSLTWIQEVRSIYDLGMTNVRNDGFFLEVYKENDDRTRKTIIDADDEVPDAIGWTFNEYMRLDTNGDTIVNGDDATVNLGDGLIILPFIRPFEGLGDEAMYVKNSLNSYDVQKLNFFIKGRIGRDQINLGSMMILPGSVRVRINGKEAVEYIDYLVDYDFGSVSFLTPEGKDPDSNLEINFENRAMMMAESKTMLGYSAEWKPADYFKMSNLFYYHSEKVSDKRPKIGAEGRTLMLAALGSELTVKMPLLTKAVDLIPLVNTDDSSTIVFKADVAMNIPRVHGSESFGDGNEAWIDDMESVLDVYPLGITRTVWVPASEPYSTNLIKSRVNWFNATNVYARDVYPPNTLSAKDKTEKVSVLDVKLLPPPIHSPGITNNMWGGLMKFVGNQVDFSEKEYIEFLIKVDSLDTTLKQLKMNIDLGDVSEDWYTDFGGRGVLNTEDGVNGTLKDGRFEARKDVGFSGGQDPWEYFSATEINGEFPYINGTVGNGRLDTEDLNNNGRLDTTERFLRYSVSLSEASSPYLLSENNGWRLYRIPLHKNDEMQSVSNVSTQPKLTEVSFARFWFESEDMVKIRIIYLDIIGNKWLKMSVKEREEDGVVEKNVLKADIDFANEFISIETIDNQKSSKYTSPSRTTEKGRDGEISYEQSLQIQYNNIGGGHLALARQRLRESLNLLSYNKVRYWVYIEDSQHPSPNNADELDIIFRMGADSLAFYEVSKRLPVNPHRAKMDIFNWVEFDIDFKDLTKLKTVEAVTDTTSGIDLGAIYVNEEKGITYRMLKIPTLSNIRDIAIGIRVPDGKQFTGTVYYDDIRVADPNTNIGYVFGGQVNTKLADFSNFVVDYEWRSADFYNTTNRNAMANTGAEDKVTLNLSNSYSLHKFFPNTWGLRFPLNL
ncbi:MAG: cell surface protein SprA, partial [Candidatus Cloacimonetes bacterium]|nr:cell surface protein SprA [Candidatus Cloacimonadota bacterium]